MSCRTLTLFKIRTNNFQVTVMRDLEQDKRTLRLDKVNQVLKLFGYEVGAIPVNRKNLIHEES
jgi:hypothetical protein